MLLIAQVLPRQGEASARLDAAGGAAHNHAMRLSERLWRMRTSTWHWPVIGRLAQAYEARLNARNFEQAGMDAGQYVPNNGGLRRATDHQLHTLIASPTTTAAERIALERERSMRDARQAAKGSTRISLAALAVAAISAIPTVYGWARHDDANDRRCLAIQRDMLSARPRRTDGPDLFQALGCRPQGEGSVYAPRTH